MTGATVSPGVGARVGACLASRITAAHLKNSSNDGKEVRESMRSRHSKPTLVPRPLPFFNLRKDHAHYEL